MIFQRENMMSKQRGFSLIEALVAFLILSIGLLGIASLQLISLKAGHTAELRTVVVIKTEEIFERIRSNPGAMASYVSAAGADGTVKDCINTGTGTADINMCSSVDMALDDVANWKLSLKASMPVDTTASIAVVDAEPGTRPTAIVTVTVNWKERNPETQTMDDMSYSVSSHICPGTAC